MVYEEEQGALWKEGLMAVQLCAQMKNAYGKPNAQ